MEAAGYRAYNENLGIMSNPYNRCDPLHFVWNRGWNRAGDEYLRLEQQLQLESETYQS